MKKRWVMPPVVVLLLAATIASATAVLASPDDGISSSSGEWQLKYEAMQSKLDALVDSDLLTQEQADQKLDWLRSNQGSLTKKSFDGDMEAYLSALVEKGKLTQEQADEKLRVLQAKEALKTNSY